MPNTTEGRMTVQEAGRRGGLSTAKTHGKNFYMEIGRKGGKSVSRDRKHMAAIGRKGGKNSHKNERF